MEIYVYTVNEEKFKEITKKKDGKIINGLETNMMHPSKIFDFAEKIIENAKKNNKNVYINTYNDILVEAIEVLAVKHKIEKFVRFFMNTPEDLNVREIFFGNISEIYEPLGAYDEIDRTRLRNTLRC